jgi:hypothetical protein
VAPSTRTDHGAFDDDGVFVAAEGRADDDAKDILLRAGRRVVGLWSRFFADDEDRRHEVDRLLQLLDASSAAPPIRGSASWRWRRPRCRAHGSERGPGFSIRRQRRLPSACWRPRETRRRGAAR